MDGRCCCEFKLGVAGSARTAARRRCVKGAKHRRTAGQPPGLGNQGICNELSLVLPTCCCCCCAPVRLVTALPGLTMAPPPPGPCSPAGADQRDADHGAQRQRRDAVPAGPAPQVCGAAVAGRLRRGVGCGPGGAGRLRRAALPQRAVLRRARRVRPRRVCAHCWGRSAVLLYGGSRVRPCMHGCRAALRGGQAGRWIPASCCPSAQHFAVAFSAGPRCRMLCAKCRAWRSCGSRAARRWAAPGARERRHCLPGAARRVRPVPCIACALSARAGPAKTCASTPHPAPPSHPTPLPRQVSALRLHSSQLARLVLCGTRALLELNLRCARLASIDIVPINPGLAASLALKWVPLGVGVCGDSDFGGSERN